MKKQRTFRPIVDERLITEQLHQGELWDGSSSNRTGAEPGGSSDKENPPLNEQPKPSREQVDADRMERARKLAAEPNYPTQEIIQDLADMLARHWYS